MNENLRDKIADAVYASGDEPEWLTTADGSPNAAAFEYADRVLSVVGPELDRLRAEVERYRIAFLKANESCTAREMALAALYATHDRKLADAWDEGHGTSNGGCVYWPDCAEIGHHVNPYRAALASVPEPSDSEPAPDADREVCGSCGGSFDSPPCCTIPNTKESHPNGYPRPCWRLRCWGRCLVTAREPSAVEVIADASLSGIREYMGVPDADVVWHYSLVKAAPIQAEAALAALKAAGFVVATRNEIRAMSASEQAEMIGGYVDQHTEYLRLPGAAWYPPSGERVVGPWRGLIDADVTRDHEEDER